MNKKIGRYIGSLLALAPLVASAESPDIQQGTKSIAFAIFPEDRPSVGLNGKYFFNDSTALIGELDLGYRSSEASDNFSTTKSKDNFISVAGGIRKYSFTGDVSFFSDTVLFVRYEKNKFNEYYADGSSSSGNASMRSAGAKVLFGTEYFFSPQVSLSATIGFQYSYLMVKSTTNSSSTSSSYSDNSKDSSLSTGQTAILLNYYW